MKVFVTGATGLVGTYTALELMQYGHQVRLLVRNKPAVEQWFQRQGIALQEQDIVVGDMLHATDVVQAMQGCDAVVHAAAAVNLDKRHAKATLHQNLQGMENVIGGACQLGIEKILYVSSISAIFHATELELHEQLPITKSHDPYSLSKAKCEEVVRQWQCEGHPIICTYPSGIFGPDDPKLSQANDGLRLMYNDFIPLTSSGMQFVDVRDVAKAHRLLLEKPLPHDCNSARYILGGHYMPWREFAHALSKLGHKKKVKTIYMPGAFLRAVGWAMDAIRLLIPINYPISYEAALIVTRMPPCNSDYLLANVDMQFRPAEQTLAETIAWLYQAGHLK